MRKRQQCEKRLDLNLERATSIRKNIKSVLNGEQPFMEICVQEKSAKEKPPLILPPSLDGCEVKSDPKMENDRGPEPNQDSTWRTKGKKQR
ncbi:hypothetical protein TNCV_540951 [Trichonephila clavipes]|nr:hypothetical protein TNCV_540951 [Trichonephila clavipes]